LRPICLGAIRRLRPAWRRSNGDFVFPSVRSPEKPFAGLPKAWARIIGKHLPETPPHVLRHAFASSAEELGFTIPTIKALLGHANSGVTEGYIHKQDAALVAAADTVSAWIAEAMALSGRQG